MAYIMGGAQLAQNRAHVQQRPNPAAKKGTEVAKKTGSFPAKSNKHSNGAVARMAVQGKKRG